MLVSFSWKLWGAGGSSEREICRWIKWEAASNCQFTLNTDGSSKVGVCSGGGIVRDQKGVIMCAFSNYYGNGTNMVG